MRFDRLCGYVFFLILANLGLFSNAAAKQRIVPLRTSVTFPSRSGANRWSVPIKSTGGSTLYILTLEQDFDVGHHLVTLELVLRHAGHRTDAPNLFYPTGRVHGLQACDFAANDLAQGVQKSAFGEERTVSVKSLGLVVRIAVSDAKVSPISVSNYQLDMLELQIEVDNYDP